MYCPNCGAQNKKKQNYCRYCGLHLQDIEKSYLSQLVFGEDTKRLKNLRKVRKFVDYVQFLSFVLGLIGIYMLFFSDAATGKNLMAISLTVFILPQTVQEIISYFYRRSSRENKRTLVSNETQQNEVETGETKKLTEDKPFAAVLSVTEGETELLYADRNSTKKFQTD